MKVMTILGTRPELIRLSRIIEKLDSHCTHVLVHTGQNYDKNLKDIFFKELGIRQPDYFLDVKGVTLGEQLGQILARNLVDPSSGLVTDYWPWGELPIFTQLFRYTKSPFGFIPFPGYIPADDPLFDNGTLLMPTLFEYDAATITGKELLNVEGHISDITGVTWDNELSVDEPMFKVRTKELHLPTLKFNGDVYRGVIATGVIWKYEEQK